MSESIRYKGWALFEAKRMFVVDMKTVVLCYDEASQSGELCASTIVLFRLAFGT
jgi:hypothetical protein